eukprot:s1649_g5.t1
MKLGHFHAHHGIVWENCGGRSCKAATWRPWDVHVDALTLAVCLVEPHGLVAAWNAAHPGCMIEPGDRLVSVNGLCHPEVVMEHLSAEFSLRIVVEKKGGFAGALVPHSKFAVQLQRAGDGPMGFGFEVNPETLEVLNVADDGQVAQWNLWHPFRAIVVGDRIVEINGEVHSARYEVLMESFQIDMTLLRGQGSGSKGSKGSSLAAYGTFGVTLTTCTEPVGFGVSFSTLEVEKVEATGAVQKWNAANPINKLRLGDRLVQVNGKADPKSIQAELKAHKELKLVVARAERRIDQNRSLLTLKECQAAWPKDPDRWRRMVRMGGPTGQTQAVAALATAGRFEVELQRLKDQPWGLELGPDARLTRVVDGGLLARWNWRHPSRAVVQGDRLMINGFSESKALQQCLKQSLGIRLAVMRQGAMSTFGIKLVKTVERKLGLKLSEDVEVTRIDPEGALALWNAANPLLEVHLGDRILQVGETATPEQIFRSLQSSSELDFLIGRCPRRLDAATGQILSHKECEAAYGKEAVARWAAMQLVPDAPDHVREGVTERQYLGAEGAEHGDENRPLLASESFYRSLVDVHPGTVQRRHRLFHVFLEDGRYHALPATGALAGMQVKPSEAWSQKAPSQAPSQALPAPPAQKSTVDI